MFPSILRDFTPQKPRFEPRVRPAANTNTGVPLPPRSWTVSGNVIGSAERRREEPIEQRQCPVPAKQNSSLVAGTGERLAHYREAIPGQIFTMRSASPSGVVILFADRISSLMLPM